MDLIILNKVAKARITDLHRQAERDRIARAARHDRKPRRRRYATADRATGLARRVRAVLAARSLRPPHVSTSAAAESHDPTQPRPPAPALVLARQLSNRGRTS
jgi:hypothetical protein